MKLADSLQLQHFQDLPHSTWQPQANDWAWHVCKGLVISQHGAPLPAVLMPEPSIELRFSSSYLSHLSSPPFYLPVPVASPFIIQSHSHESLSLPTWTWHLLPGGSKLSQLILRVVHPWQQIAKWTFRTRLLIAQRHMRTPMPQWHG